MTKVSYVVTLNNKEVPSGEYVSYAEVNNVVKHLNEDSKGTGYHFSYVTKYTDYDPEDTPERRERAKEHARKVFCAIKERGGFIK